MIPRAAKAAYYGLAGPLMALNGMIYRALGAPRDGLNRVHLGPGQSRYLQGWINVDANIVTAKPDVWADMRRKLPFRDNSIDAFYSHQVIEHLPDIAGHFRDVHRCLRPGGVYRVGAPNADSAIRKFLEEDSDWFGDFPEKRDSVGGKLDNFILCGNEHLSIITKSYMTELLSKIGFEDIEACLPTRETRFPDLFGQCLSIEWERDFEAPHVLLLEAVKSRDIAA
jgi:SAM-dependent methyltransferase